MKPQDQKPEWETQECSNCHGDGFTAEHDDRDPHEDGCSNCPTQVQCDYCHAEGKLMTLDKVKTLIQLSRDQERREVLDEVLKLSCTHTMDGLCSEIIDKRKQL